MNMKKPKLGSGVRFKKLASKVTKSEMKSGKSAKVAKKIGAATAAKIGIKKYGKEKMMKMAAKGRAKKS